jgi:uroporphyrinogen-III decarboxylase
MNSRERVIKAINHQEPDRVPVDLGATPVSGISVSAMARLRDALGLERMDLKVHEPFQLLGQVEKDLLDAVKGDVIGLWSGKTCWGYRNDSWKNWTLPDGTDVVVGVGFTIKPDENGDYVIYPGGDESAPPSGKLPKDGFYFDNISRQESYDEENLNGREDFENQWSIFTEEELKDLEERSACLSVNTEYGIIGVFDEVGLGDAARWPGPGLKKTPGIRDIDEWLMAHIIHADYVNDVYDLQVEKAIENLKLYKEAVGERIQAIMVSGTDFGTQRCEFISPDMFREFYKPRYKKVNDWIHENTNWKTFYHSCGSIVNVLDDFVEMGVDILNPVQCSAVGMDPQFLKDKYGDKLVFWGGGIDTQKTLPFGTPDEVREETAERLGIFSKGGGYIFNPIHNIQAPTPVENIVAMFDSVNHFNSQDSK